MKKVYRIRPAEVRGKEDMNTQLGGLLGHLYSSLLISFPCLWLFFDEYSLKEMLRVVFSLVQKICSRRMELIVSC